MRLTTETCLRRFAATDHAVLATTGADLRPRLVPVTFALLPAEPAAEGGARFEVVTAVDHKPKSTHDLRRLRDVAENPHVALLCERYDADWERLWWVRADGTATVEHDGAAWRRAIEALVARYPQYEAEPPSGPVLRVRVERWAGWAYRDPDLGTTDAG